MPFLADTPEAMLAAAEGQPPAAPSTRRPGIPRRLDAAVAQALDPEGLEFRNARAMAAALESAIATSDARVDETEVVPASPAPEAGYVPPLVLPSGGPPAPRTPASASPRAVLVVAAAWARGCSPR